MSEPRLDGADGLAIADVINWISFLLSDHDAIVPMGNHVWRPNITRLEYRFLVESPVLEP